MTQPHLRLRQSTCNKDASSATISPENKWTLAVVWYTLSDKLVCGLKIRSVPPRRNGYRFNLTGEDIIKTSIILVQNNAFPTSQLKRIFFPMPEFSPAL